MDFAETYNQTRDRISRSREKRLAELVAENERLRTVLNQALGVIVEFGDINGFRNCSNEELGRTVTAVAERAAEALNNPK